LAFGPRIQTCSARPGIEMHLANTSTVAVLQLALWSPARRRTIFAEGIGMTSGGTHAVDVVHQERTRRSNVAGGLDPAHHELDFGQLAYLPDDFELMSKGRRSGTRHVLPRGLHPGHSVCSIGCRSCCHRAVKMMVSEGHSVGHPLSTFTSGVAPPGHTVDSHCDSHRAGRWWCRLLERCMRRSCDPRLLSFSLDTWCLSL